MGVIGRLDDQVNEIIIKPVSERRNDAEPEAPRADSQEPAPPERPSVEEDEGRAKTGSSELPVWLL
ncbi:MAG TPA: hypothetical protein VJS44_13070 [Pyrinomonadaceae bacterium]|nr:hypothetical protein [Pyrinomonadaceae bacterium]